MSVKMKKELDTIKEDLRKLEEGEAKTKDFFFFL